MATKCNKVSLDNQLCDNGVASTVSYIVCVSTLMMEAETVFKILDHNSTLMWLIVQEDFIAYDQVNLRFCDCSRSSITNIYLYIWQTLIKCVCVSYG
jgi:hypothetical protein